MMAAVTPKKCPHCGTTLVATAIRDDRMAGGTHTDIGWRCPNGGAMCEREWPMSFDPRPDDDPARG
jgi:hypothetical protein